MPKLAPIGSIVRVQDVLLVVVGHRMARDENNVGMCYMLVPYPLGFVTVSSLSLTPVSKIDEVVEEGLHTSEGDEYLASMEELMAQAEGLDYDAYADAVLAFKLFLKKEGATHE